MVELFIHTQGQKYSNYAIFDLRMPRDVSITAIDYQLYYGPATDLKFEITKQKHCEKIPALKRLILYNIKME